MDGHQAMKKRTTRSVLLSLAVFASFTLGIPCFPAPVYGTIYLHHSPVALSWLPASGSIQHYNVYLSVDGGPFQLLSSVSTNLCDVHMQDSHSYVIQLDAEDEQGGRGPMSDPSETLVYFANGSENDTDGDGLPNAWETEYGLNPFQDDSQEDPDGDGLSNLEEYLAGTNPLEPPPQGNRPPDQPDPLSPANGETEVSLTPELRADSFSDPDGDAHKLSEWEISGLFGLLHLEISSHDHLTALTVPDAVLDEGGLYRWRVRFQDAQNGWSEWSDDSFFWTLTTSSDANRNGIIDQQEVEDETMDLDGDGVSDIHQEDMKCVKTAVGNGVMALKRSTGVTSIATIRAMDPDSIPDAVGRPEELPLGLIAFRLDVLKPGDSAEVTVYLSEPAPDGAGWYKVDSIKGWQEYTDYVLFSTDRRSVTLSLQDGGYGDTDGTANGRIVDPGGFGGADSGSSSPPPVSANEGVQGGGGGGCFIATAAYGSPLEAHVRLLHLFRDQCLLRTDAGVAFVNLYYTYSPPLAEFLAQRDRLRAMTRVLLLPLVGLSRVALETSLWDILVLAVVLSCFLGAVVLRLGRLYRAP